MAMSPRSPIVRDDGAARDGGGGSERGAFRRRAAAALTHPLTLAALAVLLVNDIALKRAWPDAWATGKLSDLAWMIFAPPLLAYLLSFLVDGRALGGRAGFGALGGRAGFGAAYLGLPLLYAAFNTFEPVHNAALRGLALVGGSSHGTPLDATDSVVIPFAMAAALWVWRRPPASPQSVRARLALLAMAVAALATVATSYAPPVEGVTAVWIGDDGNVYARAEEGDGSAYSYDAALYKSADGGYTWGLAGRTSFYELFTIARTPSGVAYVIDGPDVFREDGGERELVYSTEAFAKRSNVWLHIRDTREYGRRIPTFTPRAIAYDDASGNVIAAMGMHGVAVVAPDGTELEVVVGQFMPSDFSFVNKLRELPDEGFLWLAVALAVSFTALGLSPVALSKREKRTWGHLCAATVTFAPALICSIAILFAGLYPSETLGGDLIEPDAWKAVIGLFALIIAVAGIAASCPTWRQALAGVAAMVGMLLLTLLTFMLWLQVDWPLRAAEAFVVLLVGLAAFALHLSMARSARGSARDGSAAPG